MLGVRSILGFNGNIKINIKNILIDEFEFNSHIVETRNQIDSKQKIHYCFKNCFYYSEYNSFYFILKKQEIFSELFDFLDSTYFEKNTHIEGVKINKIFDNLNGVKKINKEINKNIILNLWNYYLLINNLYIYNNNLYSKLNNYNISYKKEYKIDILYKSFKEKIIPFFILTLPIQFLNYDFYGVMTKYIIQYKSLINTLILITFNKFNPNYNLLEFKDGVYNIKTNEFLSKKQIKESDLINVFTIKNYNFTFKHLKDPEIWKKNIEKVLNNDNKNTEKIYLFIANIFHQNIFLFNKKNVLFIIDNSNTQKFTLITRLLINYFGEENIGVITWKSNFNFQDIHDKMLVVVNEYKHNSKFENNLLKWFEDNNIKSEQKYKNLENKPMIIISNNDIKSKNDRINEIFDSRFIKLKFNEINGVIINKIKEEEASIIIHCNKIYFKNIINKKTRLNYKNSIDFL